MPSNPRFNLISIDELDFDPENPRLPERLNPSDRIEVLRFMLEDAGLIDLMGSIAKQGFFPGEPMLVSPKQNGSGSIVVEGNRRFASCLLLAHPELAPTKRRQVTEVASIAESEGNVPLSVPCLQFEARSDILAHLGYRHVTGIKEWEPLAKARFLHQRFSGEDGTNTERFKSLARSIGSRSDYVGRLLTAYELYRRAESKSFYSIPGIDSDSLDFSLLTSLLAYTAVVNYLGLESSQDLTMAGLEDAHLEFLMAFVFHRVEGRTALGESRNMRTLADVLDSPRARDALEGGAALSVAAALTAAGSQAFRSWVAGARENLVLATDELESVRPGTDDVDNVTEVSVLASTLAEATRTRFENEHD